MDLNSDLGEGFGVWRLGDDDALLAVVTSANVACGFHAGDPPTMRRVCERAVANGVVVGAQVSYRDLAGFGRRRIDIAAADLADDVVYQIGALDAFARGAGDRVRYVKAHGALYASCMDDPEQAAAVVDAVCRYDPTLPVLGLPGSQLLRLAAAAGLVAVPEGFADRAYDEGGRLVSRRRAGAVLEDVEAVAARCVQMATQATVRSVDGSTVAADVRSLCVHGDTAGAVAMARRVRSALEEAGVALAPFAGVGG